MIIEIPNSDMKIQGKNEEKDPIPWRTSLAGWAEYYVEPGQWAAGSGYEENFTYTVCLGSVRQIIRMIFDPLSLLLSIHLIG